MDGSIQDGVSLDRVVYESRHSRKAAFRALSKYPNADVVARGPHVVSTAYFCAHRLWSGSEVQLTLLHCSDRVEVISAQVDKIEHMLSSAMSSPSQTPISSPLGLSPDPTPAGGPSAGPASQAHSPEAMINPQDPPVAPETQLPDPVFDLNFNFGHNVDAQLQLPDSFPRSTPGDQYRHVQLASSDEQQAFVNSLVTNKSFIEMFVPHEI